MQELMYIQEFFYNQLTYLKTDVANYITSAWNIHSQGFQVHKQMFFECSFNSINGPCQFKSFFLYFFLFMIQLLHIHVAVEEWATYQCIWWDTYSCTLHENNAQMLLCSNNRIRVNFLVHQYAECKVKVYLIFFRKCKQWISTYTYFKFFDLFDFTSRFYNWWCLL